MTPETPGIGAGGAPIEPPAGPDGARTYEYPDGTVHSVYPDSATVTRYPNGTTRTADPAGNVTVTEADGTRSYTPAEPATPPPRSPAQAAHTEIDEASNIHVFRSDGTEETTWANGLVSVRRPDGSSVEYPPRPQVAPADPSAPRTFTLTGTDGTVLTVSPYGIREVTDPSGLTRTIEAAKAPPITTHDADGTEHIYDADGTHTVVDTDGVRTVIPARPLDEIQHGDLERDLQQDWAHDPLRRGPNRDAWTNPGADGTTQVSHNDGRTEVVHGDGTAVQFPAPPQFAVPRELDHSSGHDSSVDPDGTRRHRPGDGSLLTTHPDGTTFRTDPNGTTLVTHPDGRTEILPATGPVTTFAQQDERIRQRDQPEKGRAGCSGPVIAVVVTILVAAGIGGILVSMGDDDGDDEDAAPAFERCDRPDDEQGLPGAPVLIAFQRDDCEDETTTTTEAGEPTTTVDGGAGSGGDDDDDDAFALDGSFTAINGEAEFGNVLINEIDLRVTPDGVSGQLRLQLQPIFGPDDFIPDNPDGTICFDFTIDLEGSLVPVQIDGDTATVDASVPGRFDVTDGACGGSGSVENQGSGGTLTMTASADGGATGQFVLNEFVLDFVADSS